MINQLKKLKNKNDVVCLTIKSGRLCCRLTGCIRTIINDKIIVLINNNLQNIYIPLDCICAIQKQESAIDMAFFENFEDLPLGDVRVNNTDWAGSSQWF